MSNTIETIVIGTSGKFDLRAEFSPECDVDFKDYFVNDCGWTEDQFEEIKHNEWFSVEVIASINGIDLGSSCIGCCCYLSFEDFVNNSDYLPELEQEAIESAERTLDKLLDTWAKV